MPGRVGWIVLMSRSVEGAKSFYRDTLGWRFEPKEDARNPTWLATGSTGDPVALLIDTSGSGFPDAPEIWLACLIVDRLDERIRDAEAHGATIMREPFEIAGFGRVAILRQPGGALVGWMSPAATP